MTLRLRYAAPAAVLVTVAIVGGSTGQQAAAAPLPACDPNTLVPQLGAVTINQGVGSYANSPGLLVRGKETLVKLFLKLPAGVGTTCSGSISVVSPTSLALINPASPAADLPSAIAPYQSYPSTGLSIPSATVSVNASADPVFVVPGSRLNPCYIDQAATSPPTACTTETGFTMQFRGSISYIRNGSTATVYNQVFSTQPASSSLISAGFDKRTNALRVLVIPMGDKSLLYSTQFTESGRQAVINGFLTLSRILPVPAGVSSTLAVTTENARYGIRYLINGAAMLDLKSVSGAYNSSNRFCGSQSNFNAIKTQLAQFLQDYNTNPVNAGHPADRVLGVVDKAISDGSAANCAEGYGSTSSTEAWVRAIPDLPAGGGKPAAPSMTGGLMAMELLHTMGQEKQTAANVTYHSKNTQADGLTPDRAYDVTQRLYVANDLTALRFVNTTSAPWNNNTVFMEGPGSLAGNPFGTTLCNLSPSPSFGTDCSTLAPVGAPPAAGGTGHFTLSVTTDGTAAGTKVANSFFVPAGQDVLETACLTSGTYKLVFATPGEDPVCYVPSTGQVSEHLALFSLNTTTDTITGTFPSPGGETEVGLYKDTTLLRTFAVQPSSPDLALGSFTPGGSLDATKTMTTPEIAPKPDIYFLADTTGSMGPTLSQLKTDVRQVLNDVKRQTVEPRFGAGDYKDFTSCAVGVPPPCFSGAYAFQNAAPIPAADDDGNGALAAIGINDDPATTTTNEATGWTASDGGDRPEGQLFALTQLASPSSTGFNPAWRSDSSRIVVWFGDNPGHDPVCGTIRGDGPRAPDITRSTVASALMAAGIRVIAVSVNTGSLSLGLDGDATSDGADYYATACGPVIASAYSQATTFANATGGVVKTASSPSEITQAILAGLRDLDATVTHTHTCNTGLALTFDAASKTVPSGEPVSFAQTVTIASTASVGATLTCQVQYLINDKVVKLADGVTPDPAFQQTITVPVTNDSKTQAYATSTAPELKGTIFYSCGGSQLVADSSVPFADLAGSLFQLSVNADTVNTSNACGDSAGNGTVTVVASDSTQQTDVTNTAPTTTVVSDREPPVASVHTPTQNAVWPEFKPFALNGLVTDDDDGDLEASWSVTGPVSLSGITGSKADVAPPAGKWPVGDYTVTISGTDSNGNRAVATTTVHVRSYTFVGFNQPIDNPPVVNTGRTNKTYPVKWKLYDRGALVTDLAAVSAIRYAGTTCDPAPADVIETTATGGTELRFDSSTGEMVYNWKAPAAAGCYVLSIQFDDGSTYVAYFKLS